MQVTSRMIKSLVLLCALGSIAGLQGSVQPIKSAPTSSAIRRLPQGSGMSDADAQRLPFYWMRLINIMSKALEICNLDGNDRILFVQDLNSVMQSPVSDRSALERIRFSRVLASAIQHKAFATNTKAQQQLNTMYTYVLKTITLDDYFLALNILLAADKISEKRSTEAISYMWIVATTDQLDDANKNHLIDVITNTAMPKMPAFRQDLQRILDFLNRKPEVVVQTQVVQVPTSTPEQQRPDMRMRDVSLKGAAGMQGRRTGTHSLRYEDEQRRLGEARTRARAREDQDNARAAAATGRRGSQQTPDMSSDTGDGTSAQSRRDQFQAGIAAATGRGASARPVVASQPVQVQQTPDATDATDTSMQDTGTDQTAGMSADQGVDQTTADASTDDSSGQ